MAHPPQTDLPSAALEHKLRARPTPLLRISGGAELPAVFAKLESLRPSGGTDDRAAAIWDRVALALERELLARLSSGAVLAGAGWARARGRSLRAIVHGTLTHEVSETLLLWGATVERAGSRAEAISMASARAESGAQLLPALDGPDAVAAMRATLGQELLHDFEEAALAPSLVVAPAGSLAALAGSFAALRKRWPELRGFALCAASASDVLPDLPEQNEAEQLLAGLPGHALELILVTRDEAQFARAQLARSHGLSASHASAAAIAKAQHLAASLPHDEKSAALALVTATGEREFSLDPAPPPSAAFDASQTPRA